MASTFDLNNKVVQQGSNQNIVCGNTGTNSNVPSAVGSRIIPKDGYRVVAGTRFEFQASFTDTDKPIQVDVNTKPRAIIRENGVVVFDIAGELSQNQLYEYSFFWDSPVDLNNRNTYNVEYHGFLGGVEFVFGSEYIVVSSSPSNIKLKQQAYATVDEVRMDKNNIDTFLPPDLKGDKLSRDAIIHQQLVTATKELNGQLNLRDFHSSYNDNFNLYTRYHAIWAIMGSSMGEDGSAVSEKSLGFWEKRWKAVLKQIKMHSQLSNIPSGRA